MYSEIPNQRIPQSRKTREWAINTMEAYFSLADFGRTNRKEELRKLYDYYNGVIHDDDYRYVVQPYGKARKNFPSKMRNYPLIKPIVDLLLGEKAKRPLNYSVTVQNSDSVSRMEEEKKTLVLNSMKQMFVNEMNMMGMDTGVPTQDIQLPEELANMFERSYTDTRAILGQKGMNYIMQDCKVHEKLQKGWFHFLVSGECYTERGVRNGNVFYDILNPLDVDYDLDPDLDYVEDGDWAMVTKYMHPSSVIEAFGRDLKPDQIDQVFQSAGSGSFIYNSTYMDRQDDLRDRLVRVRILYWQSMQRTGFVSYYDPETGSMEMFDVEDGYRLPQELKDLGAKMEWEWHNLVYQGICIGEDIYINMRPFDNQRMSINNPSKNKLPINGRKYSDINTTNISLVMLGIPYQLNYNVYKYRLELAIARSKDIIAQLDINMIPKKWDMDKFMYYVEGTGIAWIDYNKEGVKLSPQHQSVLDLSMKTMGMYVELLNSIQMEWERVSGVNRQRMGGMSQYDGKATSQQAIVQSAHTTEDLYRKFAGVEQRDLQALLDYSKEAWITGKEAQYVMPDGTTEFFAIDPLPYLESDLGIFVSDATKEIEKLNLMREFGMGMLQSGTPPSTVADIVDSENFVMMKDKIKQAEASRQELEAAQSQAEQQLRQAEIQMKEAEVQNENMNKQLDRDNKLEVAEIYNRDREVTVTDDSAKNRANDIKEMQVKESERSNRAKEDIARKKDSDNK
jgi:hypothetical protein